MSEEEIKDDAAETPAAEEPKAEAAETAETVEATEAVQIIMR